MKHIIFIAFLAMGLPSIAQEAGGEVGNGGNFATIQKAHINTLDQDKIERARGILLAVLKNVSLDQMAMTTYGQEVKDLFIRHYHSSHDSNQWIQTLRKAQIIPERSPFKSDAIAYHQSSPQRIEVRKDVLRQRNELELAQLLAHELGHLMGYGKEYENRLDIMANLIFSSVKVKDSKLSEVRTDRLVQAPSIDEIIKNIYSTDSFRSGPEAPYMKRMDENYRMATEARSNIWKIFLEKIQETYKNQADENGVLRIVTPIVIDGRHGRAATTTPGTSWEGHRGREGAAYVKAVKAAFGPASGLKVASVDHIQVMKTYYDRRFEENAKDNGDDWVKTSQIESYYAVFVVPNPEASADYEILKWKTFKRVEDAVGDIREQAKKNQLNQELEKKLLREYFLSLSEDEIEAFVKGQLKQLNLIEIKLKQIETEADLESFLSELSQDRSTRVNQLTQKLRQLKEKERQAQSQEEIEEIKAFIQKLEKDYLK